MLRGFILLILLGVAGFLGYKLWTIQTQLAALESDQVNPPPSVASSDSVDNHTPQAVPQNEVSASYKVATSSRDLEVAARNRGAQESTLEGIANHVAAKGATILDKRVFESIEACSSAVATVVQEYKRRGVAASNIIDSSALLGDIPGATMTSINNIDFYLYLTCYPHPQNRWAGYIQFSMTPEQLKAANEERALQGR